MGLNVKNFEAGGGKLEGMLSAGPHHVRLLEVIDLGIQKKTYQGKDQGTGPQFTITFEVCDEDVEVDGEVKRRWLSWGEINAVASSKKVQQLIAALDPEGKFDGDLAAMVGQAALVTVVHQAKQANPAEKYAKIDSVTKPMPGMQVPEMLGEGKVYDFDNPNQEVFDSLPEFKQKKIKSALNYESGGQNLAAPAAAAEEAPVSSSDCPF